MWCLLFLPSKVLILLLLDIISYITLWPWEAGQGTADEEEVCETCSMQEQKFCCHNNQETNIIHLITPFHAAIKHTKCSRATGTSVMFTARTLHGVKEWSAITIPFWHRNEPTGPQCFCSILSNRTWCIWVFKHNLAQGNKETLFGGLHSNASQ